MTEIRDDMTLLEKIQARRKNAEENEQRAADEKHQRISAGRPCHLIFNDTMFWQVATCVLLENGTYEQIGGRDLLVKVSVDATPESAIQAAIALGLLPEGARLGERTGIGWSVVE